MRMEHGSATDRGSHSDRKLPSSRDGYTLIELMAVIAMLSLLFSMAAVLLGLMLQSDETVSRQQLLEQTLRRLAEQFRDDVHSATDCRFALDHPRGAIEMELTGIPAEIDGVRYRMEGDALIRESLIADKRDENVVAKPVAREAYQLPECRVSFRAATDVPPRGVVLSVERAGLVLTSHPRESRPTRQFTVEAELGRNRRQLSALKPPSAARGDSTRETPQ